MVTPNLSGIRSAEHYHIVWYYVNCACVRVCVCVTLTRTRTDTSGFKRVDGKPGVAIPALGRAVSGAGGAGFGITVHTRALFCCADKRALRFRRSQECVSIVISYSLVVIPMSWLFMSE